MTLSIVILAAGKNTRFKSLPKDTLSIPCFGTAISCIPARARRTAHAQPAHFDASPKVSTHV